MVVNLFGFAIGSMQGIFPLSAIWPALCVFVCSAMLVLLPIHLLQGNSLMAVIHNRGSQVRLQGLVGDPLITMCSLMTPITKA